MSPIISLEVIFGRLAWFCHSSAQKRKHHGTRNSIAWWCGGNRSKHSMVGKPFLLPISTTLPPTHWPQEARAVDRAAHRRCDTSWQKRNILLYKVLPLDRTRVALAMKLQEQRTWTFLWLGCSAFQERENHMHRAPILTRSYRDAFCGHRPKNPAERCSASQDNLAPDLSGSEDGCNWPSKLWGLEELGWSFPWGKEDILNVEMNQDYKVSSVDSS